MSGLRPGVYILPDQRDFTHPGINQRLRFFKNCIEAPADFCATRVGHNTIGAEFVTAFLHGQEGRCAAPRRAFWQNVEFGKPRQVEVKDALAPCRFRNKLRQAVIGLWPDNNIHLSRPTRDFGAFGLRHTSGNRDHGPRTIVPTHPTNIGVDLLRCLFANVAGVEDNKVSFIF